MSKELEDIKKRLRGFGMRVLKENSDFMNHSAQISISYNEVKALLSELNHLKEEQTRLLKLVCGTCSGYGMVGNMLDSDTCPTCKGGKIEVHNVQN